MSNRTVLVLVALLAFALVGGAIAIIVISERGGGEEVYGVETAEIYYEDSEPAEVYFEDAPQPTTGGGGGYNSRAEVEFDHAEVILESRQGSVQQARRPVNIIRDAVNKANDRD